MTTPTARQEAGAHLRPRAHFTPTGTWMNDPNGLVLHEGTYHLFFQTNPLGLEWGNMSWGHATSPDLLTWTEQDIALRFTQEEAIFSGSVVVDHDNTSGLGEDGRAPLVALYTSHYLEASPRHGTQAQSVAWSTDSGRTWQTHPGNPVLDRASSDFRDPKVFWHEGRGAWIMVAVEAMDHQVVIYTSPDLLTWEYLSTFGPVGSTAGAWECPDLFRLPVRGEPGAEAWVLVVSVGDGGPAGGSGTMYVVGDFDGTTFTAREGETGQWLDVGPDHYAAVSFDNTGERRVMIGWASNWAYAVRTPTPTWRSSMSLARDVHLARSRDGQLRLHQRPVLPEADDVLQRRFTTPAGTTRTATVTTDNGQDPLVMTVDTVGGRLRLDRSRCGDASFDPQFVPVVEAALPEHGVDVDVLVVVDGCVVEVYALDGELALTAQVFPAAALTRVTVTEVAPAV